MYPPSQRDLYIPSHSLLSFTDSPLMFILPNHHLDPLNSFLAIMESARDILRQPFYLALLISLDILVIEAGKYMFLVQLF